MEIWINKVKLIDKPIIDIQPENSSDAYWIHLQDGFSIRVEPAEDAAIKTGKAPGGDYADR